MKILWVSVVLLFLQGCSQDKNNDSPILIKGATVFDGNGNRLEGYSILLEQGTISAFTTEDKIPHSTSYTVVNASGKFIMPGLVDSHVHLTLSGFYDTRPEYVDLTKEYPYAQVLAKRREMADKYLASYLKAGVTAIYDLGSESWTLELQNGSNSHQPHVAATGPLISHYGDPGVLDRVFLNPVSEAHAKLLAQSLTAQGATGIKCWRLDWGNAEFMQRISSLVEEANRLENHVIFHVENLQQIKSALDLEAETIITHTADDALLDSTTLARLVKSRSIYIPTLTVREGYVKTMQGLLGGEYTIENPNNSVDEETWEMAKDMQQHRPYIDTATVKSMFNYWLALESDSVKKIREQNLMLLYEAGVLISVGTDAGNPITFHGPAIYRELEAMQDAGIKPIDLITMATKNGAMAMKRLDQFGTIEKGKMADLLILERDPSVDISNVRTIDRVIRKGKFLELNSN